MYRKVILFNSLVVRIWGERCVRNICRRALLYSPGDDEKKVTKALSLKVDNVILDCEDGVAANRKKEARETIRSFLDKGPVTISKPEWSVRVNSIESGLCEEDLKVILSAKYIPPTILLPKVEKLEDLDWFSETVWKLLVKRNQEEIPPMNLIMFIESARAVLDMSDICKKALDISTMLPIVPVGLVFGSDDLLADIGATSSKSATELLYVRQKLVLVAKAFRLQAIDIANIHFKDLEQLRVECEAGARMGYTGKQVIHPDQVSVVQTAFMPSPKQLAWAQKVVKKFAEQQEKGKGAFTLDNVMIDMPLLKQAQNILQAAEKLDM